LNTTTRTEEYAREIRAWLLARLQKERNVGEIESPGATVLPPRAAPWWVFEGHLYPWLDSSMASAWMVINHHAQRLLATYNPRWSVAELPEGETDWVASAFQSLTAGQPSFISRASRPGLGDEERKALSGWLAWVHQEWSAYVDTLGPPAGIHPTLPWPLPIGNQPPDLRQLRRWAHVASRSRWPLMRNVVAESLRCFLEAQELDRIPLPSDSAKLFELLCMVRILDTLEEQPAFVRWLDADNGNRIDLAGLQCFYQKSLSREAVLATSEFSAELHQAMDRHQAAVPRFADGWIVFAKPRIGFNAMLIEAKSGGQAFDAAIYQLKSYRAALAKTVPGRVLVWGIIEEDPNWYRDKPCRERWEEISRDFNSKRQGDFWMFSTANEIKPVLQILGFAKEIVPRGADEVIEAENGTAEV
jgi:hypothetical protein